MSAGKSFFSPKVQRLLQAEHVERLRREGREDSFDLLTAREREVLQMIAEGNSNKEIAGRLYLSVLTVETHRKKIPEKHGAAWNGGLDSVCGKERGDVEVMKASCS